MLQQIKVNAEIKPKRAGMYGEEKYLRILAINAFKNVSLV